MKTSIKLSILAILLLSGHTVLGADISIYTTNSTLYTGDEVTVDIVVNTQEELNAVEGVLKYPTSHFKLQEVRDGNSVIHFWVEKEYDTPGEVSFSGITAGGFTGANKKVLSVVLQATADGSAQLYLDRVGLLRNDGEGTNNVTSIFNAMLDIKPGRDNTQSEAIEDLEAPEYFNPEIIADENLFDGKHALVFSTQDKGSGIDHYEVREGFFDRYQKAENPFLLRNQKLTARIYVKAIDLQGNERIITLEATNPTPWYVLVGKIVFLLLVAVAILWGVRKLVWKKK